ncbi:Cytochrome P450 2C42, partial [Varanus komodoensis]
MKTLSGNAIPNGRQHCGVLSFKRWWASEAISAFLNTKELGGPATITSARMTFLDQGSFPIMDKSEQMTVRHLLWHMAEQILCALAKLLRELGMLLPKYCTPRRQQGCEERTAPKSWATSKEEAQRLFPIRDTNANSSPEGWGETPQAGSESLINQIRPIGQRSGKPFDPQGSILTANANVMSSLIYGEYFDYKDEWFQEHINTLRSRFDFFRSFPAILYNSLPQIMDYFPGFHQMMLADSEKLCASIREKIAVSRQNLDPQNPNGFIESFLVRSEEETNTVKDFYSDGDLVMSVFALFLAAAAVTSDALLFSLVLMAKHPHIQAKVQEEIDEAVGTMRLPCSEDRKRMPFTNAVVHECQRYQIFNPEILSRKVTCHIKFRGYSIPKGTTVLPLLTSVHYDPLQWETPEKFNPNHFLDEKGHFRRRDAFMPFSAGKRSCLGESLARMELFLFFSILLQKFTFQMAGEAKNMDPFSLFLAYKRRKHPQMEAIRRS